MNKQAQTLLGVALILGAGYYLWDKSQKDKKKSFANFMSAPKFQIIERCNGTTGEKVTIGGQEYYDCCQMGYVGKETGKMDCSKIGKGGGQGVAVSELTLGGF